VAPAESLDAFLHAVRTRVDDALERYLPGPPACPQVLSDAMRYSLFAGGKRLRPTLVLAAAHAVVLHRTHTGGSHHQPGAALEEAFAIALPAACAVECIHTYSLIHDDLPAMDNDTLRRGRPTLHVVYGDGVAILAGDALQAEAFALLAQEPSLERPGLAAQQLQALQVIAQAAGATGMVGGQTIDLQAAGQVPGHETTLDRDGLRGMHQRKTGALIVAAAVAGGLMAGAEANLVTAIGHWAAQVGLAFQIVDDILDVEGDPSLLGKTAGKDAASDKPTYPAIYGLDGARRLAAECAERARTVLNDSGLTAGWLNPIADWVITRNY
jgi:geranylgeranyl pyrophosphate synthase